MKRHIDRQPTATGSGTKNSLTEDASPDSGQVSSSSRQQRRSLLSTAASAAGSAAAGHDESCKPPVAKKRAVVHKDRFGSMADADMNCRWKCADDNRSTNAFGSMRKTETAAGTSHTSRTRLDIYNRMQRIQTDCPLASLTGMRTLKNWRLGCNTVDDSHIRGDVGLPGITGKWSNDSSATCSGNRDNTEFAAPHERLKSLSNESPEEALCGLTSECSEFMKFFSRRQINDTRLVESMVDALWKACQSTYSPQSLSRLMQSVNESGFFSGPLYQHFIRHIHEMSVEFVSAVVGILKSLLHYLPSSSLGNVTQLLSHLNVWKEQHGDEIAAIENIQSTEEIKRDVTKQIKGGDLLRDKEKPPADEKEPPDDFRKIPTIPSVAEIKSDEPPFLRANIVYGAYKDADHYLDVQYRLLREDFVCPLREGLRTLQEYMDKTIPENRISDIRFYRCVQILTTYCTQRCIMYRVRFDVSQFPRVRWESSKRLIFGSLVGISKDNFETIIFGTVASRNPADLRKGEVDFCFEDDSVCLIDPNPYTVYQMVECSAYFEAYRHVLQGLQEIDSDSLPFKRYLLNQTNAKRDVRVPRYLRGENKSYNFSCLVKAGSERFWEIVPVLNLKDWPNAETLDLDDSQYSALQTAMTKEFVTIQGPPGTGKTFIGLKIVQLLLENRHHWDADESPILVVCYTNHALDQFLEGIIDMCNLSYGELVRVGGRISSQNERLQKCSLFNMKREQRATRNILKYVQKTISTIRAEMRHIQRKITKLIREMEFARKSVIHEAHLQQFMTEAQAQSLYSRGYRGCTSFIREWLRLDDSDDNDNGNQTHRDMADDDEEIVADDDDEVMRMEQERQVGETTQSLSERQQHLKDIKKASVACQQHFGVVDKDDFPYNDDDDSANPWQYAKKIRKHGKKNARRFVYTRKHYQPMSEVEWLAVDDMWALPLRDRWRLYNSWASSFCDERSVLVKYLSRQYSQRSSHLNEVNSEDDYQILRRARVVGMTTTGAAKYRQLLQRIHPRIIIVEEAAEVMESHVVTTLSPRCDHLIMIGDHQQLRPNPTVYALAKKYHLDISLFERMVKNDLHCDQLTIQHRMRPDIVKLIVPHVYKSLINHESVLEYENIRGINGNLFFVAHSEVEKSVDDTKSKSNEHEASFLSSLCLYLLQQGYKPTQITVLTMYTGQMFLLRRMMPKPLFEGIRVTPVDNFQGEENDVILLSLVRSNEEGKIGFLQTHNRVCVALSRARKGLYVIGNMDQMADASSLWNGIIKDLKANGQLVDALPLACQNHPDNVILVKNGEDFLKIPEGGCMLDCEYRLSCGHVCAKKCHPTDRMHEKYVCQKPCVKILCENGHRCLKRCFEECGKCQYLVEKVVPSCGHSQKMLCHIEPEDFACQKPCTKILCENGHQCLKSCYQECGKCQYIVEKTVPSCGHLQKMRCHVEPDEIRCQTPCTKVLPCEHMCQEVCGRPCTTECKVIVKERPWPCGHLLTVACHHNPDNFLCNFTMERILPCGHTVTATCSEDLTERKCRQKVRVRLCNDETHIHEAVCSQQSLAKYKKCTLPVQLTCPREQKHLFVAKCCDRDTQPCPMKCGATLKCGHRCTGKCSSCAQANGHKPCAAKCKEILPCQHGCQAGCGESCPPCKDRCQFHCGHRPCGKPCSEPCDVCSIPCRWFCRHHRCELPCHQPCVRPPCDRPCNSILPCGHRCIGLCGELCVPLCAVCDGKDVEQIVRLLKLEKYSPKRTRFLHLKPCGHTVEVKYMDEWVAASTPTPPYSPQGVTCPICKQMVGLCPRYNRRIKTYMRDVNAIRKASQDTHRLSNHFSRAVESFWPHKVSQMKTLLLETSEDPGSETLKSRSRYEEIISFRCLLIGAVCIWQECWNVLQTCKRKAVQPELYINQQTESLDKLKTDLIRLTEKPHYSQVVQCIFSLQSTYLYLQAQRLRTFMRNQQLLDLLDRFCCAGPLTDFSSVLKLESVINQLRSNLLHQRYNSEDFLLHLESYFEPTMKETLKKQKWLICEQGHAFAGVAECGTCARSPNDNVTDALSTESSTIRNLVHVITLKSRIKKLDPLGDSSSSNICRNDLEVSLNDALQRLCRKYDFTDQQLSSLHDEDTDEDDGDSGDGPSVNRYSDDGVSDNYDDTYDCLYDLCDY